MSEQISLPPSLSALARAGQVDLDEVLEAVVDEVVRALGAERGTLFLLDFARAELVSRVAHLPEMTEIRLKMGEGIAGWVAETGEPVTVDAGGADPRFASRIDDQTGFHTRSLLAVPMRGPDRAIIGVLQVLNHRSGAFSARDSRRLASLAAEVSQLLIDTSLGSQLRPDQRLPLAFRYNHIVGESPAMLRAYERVARAAPTEATVLITGESGTGKALVARAIHANSSRRDAPLVTVDCAALPSQLIENELFGHEKGAFTGADRARPGKVEAARGGTLFLDEVGELPLSVQGKLLRLIQERTFLPVGGTRPITVDVRFVCATWRDLAQAVEAGRFRQDLYYRLKVVPIEVPPLRARGPRDLDRLVDHFLYEFTRRHRRADLELSAAARQALRQHPWPGNVRELEHLIESAVVLAPDRVIDVEALGLGPALPPEVTTDPDLFMTPIQPLKAMERAYAAHVVSRCGGNQSEAARRLGIGRNTLARKLSTVEQGSGG